jgi:hypothetical protein
MTQRPSEANALREAVRTYSVAHRATVFIRISHYKLPRSFQNGETIISIATYIPTPPLNFLLLLLVQSKADLPDVLCSELLCFLLGKRSLEATAPSESGSWRVLYFVEIYLVWLYSIC